MMKIYYCVALFCEEMEKGNDMNLGSKQKETLVTQ